MTHGDGGKGSARRQEDVKKIHDNWDLIFKPKDTTMQDKNDKVTLDMFDESDFIEGDDTVEQEDQEYEDTCTWCGGCGEGDYDGAPCRRCHGTGVEPHEGADDDYL